MDAEKTKNDVRRLIEEKFGSRESLLGYQILMLSQFGQPCDITFYKRSPLIDVTVDQQIALAMMYGAGPKKLAEMLGAIKFSDGSIASLAEIWTVNPMPKEGFTEDQLAAVDMSEAEEPSGPNGETLRKMISETYHCKSREEEDRYLRHLRLEHRPVSVGERNHVNEAAERPRLLLCSVGRPCLRHEIGELSYSA